MVYFPYGPALFGDLGWQDVALRTVGALIFTYTILGVPYYSSCKTAQIWWEILLHVTTCQLELLCSWEGTAFLLPFGLRGPLESLEELTWHRREHKGVLAIAD